MLNGKNGFTKMTEKYYALSEDQEHWWADSIEEAIDELLPNSKVGDVLTVYEGSPIKNKASDFAPELSEIMSECAYDNCGEFTEGWLHSADKDGLQEDFKKWLDQWCTDKGHHPQWFIIDNVKELKVRITSLTEYDVEYDLIDD